MTFLIGNLWIWFIFMIVSAIIFSLSFVNRMPDIHHFTWIECLLNGSFIEDVIFVVSALSLFVFTVLFLSSLVLNQMMKLFH